MNFFIKFAFKKYLKYPVALHICGTNRARSPELRPFLQSKTTSESRCLSFHCLSVSLPFLSLVWFFPFNHKLIKASERGLACVSALTPVCCQAETMRQSLLFSAYLPFSPIHSSVCERLGCRVYKLTYTDIIIITSSSHSPTL